MIKKAKIVELFGNKHPIELNIVRSPYILTGDNGSGKTTIINYIYYGLNAEFGWFLKGDFKEFEITFDTNEYNLKLLKIDKILPNLILIKYEFLNSKDDLYMRVSNADFMSDEPEYEKIDQIEYIKYRSKDVESDFHLYEHFTFPSDSIDEFIKDNKIGYFITDIRSSLLYFPTYRRIDFDIENYLNSNSMSHSIRARYLREYEMNDFRKLESLNKDRRVIGVGNQGIEGIFKDFSDKLNKFNSDELEKLLNQFVTKVIQSVTDNPNLREDSMRIKNKINMDSLREDDEAASESLIELAETLNLEIDIENVRNYYEKKKMAREEIKKKLDYSDKKSSNIDKSGNFDIRFDNKTDLMLFLNLYNYSRDENKFIDILSKMYLDFKKKQSSFLTPYTFLEESIDLFFNGDISIRINEDSKLVLVKNQDPLNFSELSTGEKQILTLLSYIGLAIESKYFKPLTIIDEPELSLHIKWQRILLHQLSKKEDMKLIVATHSPYIANQSYSKNIVQLGEVDE